MILNVISPLISLDKVIIKNNAKYVHFVTHLDDLLNVPNDWKSIIYTSKHIAKILSIKKTPIPSKYCRAMNPNDKLTLTLKDGKTVDVIMIANADSIGTVMFYFDCPNVKALYTGPFIRYRSILFNQTLQDYVLNGIDHLYIDNTRANCTDHETIDSICIKVQDVMREFPGYQVWINIPPFGYDDLILSFVTKYKLKVFVGESHGIVFQQYNLYDIFVADSKDADIVIAVESLTMEKIKYRFDRKRLTIRFLEFNNKPTYHNFEKAGLYQFHWSPHPSLFQMYSFIEFIKPKHLHEIFPELPKIPKFLKDLCEPNKPENILAICNKIKTTASTPQKQSTIPEVIDVVSKAKTIASNYAYRSEVSMRDEIKVTEAMYSPKSKVSNYLKSYTELPRKITKKKKEVFQAPTVAVIKPHNVINGEPKDFDQFLDESMNSSLSLCSTEEILQVKDTSSEIRNNAGLDKFENQLSSKNKSKKSNPSSPQIPLSSLSTKHPTRPSQHLSGCKKMNIRDSVKYKKLPSQRKEYGAQLFDYSSSSDSNAHNNKSIGKKSTKRKSNISPGRQTPKSQQVNAMKRNLFSQRRALILYTSDEN